MHIYNTNYIITFMLYIRKRKLVIRHRNKLSFIMSNKIQLRLIPFIYASNNNFKIKNEF